jgi:hypothetical protein
MNRKLINFDESQYRVSIEVAEANGGQALQNIVDAFAGMGHGQIRNAEELQYLINDPQGFVVDKLNQGRSVQLLGLTIKKSKVFELLEELPAGWDQLQAAIEQYKTIRHAYRLADYELIKGKVQLTDAAKSRLEEEAKTYIEGENVIFAYEAAEQIAAILEKVASRHGDGANFLLTECIKYQSHVDSSNPLGHLIPGKVHIDTGKIKKFESYSNLEAERKAKSYAV